MVVYKVTNIINNKIYIGCAVNYENRIKQHKSCKYKGALLLYRAFLKYGIDNFTFEIIESYLSKEEMLLGEICHIRNFNSISPFGYNLHYGGKGGKIKLTEKQKLQRIEHYKALSRNNYGNKYAVGTVISKERKKLISQANKNKIVSDTTKKKMSENMKGNSRSKGVIRSDEYKKKMSESLKGRNFSEEHKKALSEAAKKRMLNKKRNEYGQFE